MLEICCYISKHKYLLFVYSCVNVSFVLNTVLKIFYKQKITLTCVYVVIIIFILIFLQRLKLGKSTSNVSFLESCVSRSGTTSLVPRQSTTPAKLYVDLSKICNIIFSLQSLCWCITSVLI